MTGDVFEAWAVEVLPIDTLLPHPENYREHDVGAIMESIRRWGVWRALVVQRSTRHVLVGNGELKALQAMQRAPGQIAAPVRWLDVDDENARAILLADNWIPSRGRNMPEELLALMQSLREDAELFESAGLDDDDFEDLERDIADAEKPLKASGPKPRKATCPECGHKFEIGGKK